MKGHGPTIESIMFILIPIGLTVLLIVFSSELFRVTSSIILEEEKIYDVKAVEEVVNISLNSYWSINLNDLNSKIGEGSSEWERKDFEKKDIENKINKNIQNDFDMYFKENYLNKGRVAVSIYDPVISSDVLNDKVSVEIKNPVEISIFEDVVENIDYNNSVEIESEINFLLGVINDIFDEVDSYEPETISKNTNEIKEMIKELNEDVEIDFVSEESEYFISGSRLRVSYLIETDIMSKDEPNDVNFQPTLEFEKTVYNCTEDEIFFRGHFCYNERIYSCESGITGAIIHAEGSVLGDYVCTDGKFEIPKTEDPDDTSEEDKETDDFIEDLINDIYRHIR